MDDREDPGPRGGEGFALNGARESVRTAGDSSNGDGADGAGESRGLSAREAEVMSLTGIRAEAKVRYLATFWAIVAWRN